MYEGSLTGEYTGDMINEVSIMQGAMDLNHQTEKGEQ